MAASGKARATASASHAPSGRTEHEAGPTARGAILEAAILVFVEKGFHGASMRDIAAGAGTSLAAIYHHFPSKAHILTGIMKGVTEDLIVLLKAARDRAGDDPADRLAALVRAHVRLHTERRAEAFIGNSELRSLGPRDRAEIVALRDAVSAIYKDVVAAGIERGRFRCEYVSEAVLAILSMCTAVAGWFNTDGPETPQAVAERYAVLCLRLLGCER